MQHTAAPFFVCKNRLFLKQLIKSELFVLIDYYDVKKSSKWEFFFSILFVKKEVFYIK